MVTDAAQRTLTPVDLTPPRFAEGLADWSRGDGTPASACYEGCDWTRIARGDLDFGDCLEMRKVEREQRLRYRGEMPIRPDAAVEVRVRLKALRGPLPAVRMAAWPGGLGGRGLTGLPQVGPVAQIRFHETVRTFRLVIGTGKRRGHDLVWDARALYAHVGFDLLGPCGGVLRIEDMEAREIATGAALPGFAEPPPVPPLR